MALTLRLTEEQNVRLQRIKMNLGGKTDSKTIITMMDNYLGLIKANEQLHFKTRELQDKLDDVIQAVQTKYDADRALLEIVERN